MRNINNMRELYLVRKNLKYQEMLCEKELAASSAQLINNFSEKLKDLAFETGAKLILLLLRKNKKTINKKEIIS